MIEALRGTFKRMEKVICCENGNKMKFKIELIYEM